MYSLETRPPFFSLHTTHLEFKPLLWWDYFSLYFDWNGSWESFFFCMQREIIMILLNGWGPLCSLCEVRGRTMHQAICIIPSMIQCVALKCIDVHQRGVVVQSALKKSHGHFPFISPSCVLAPKSVNSWAQPRGRLRIFQPSFETLWRDALEHSRCRRLLLVDQLSPKLTRPTI